LLNRPENLTPKQTVTLSELLKHNLNTVRASDRPASAAEVRLELERLANGGHREPPPATRSWRDHRALIGTILA
jgi:hypothetical protein